MNRAPLSGSTVPIKPQLCDASGVNYSDASIVVSASGLANSPNGAHNKGNGPNSATGDANFRYDAGIAGYMYNLSTKGFEAGTWTLPFTVNGVSDPSYSLKLDLR